MSAASFIEAVQDRVSPALLDSLAAFISETEAVLTEHVASSVRTVQGCGEQTLLGGGKRLRPALVYISAHAAGGAPDARRLSHVAAAMEMIHMATLVHDDVIDEAATRRGRPTASAVYGNTAAVLSGDVLLAKAMGLLARYSDIDVIRLVSDAVVEMAEGEVRELECRGNVDLTEDEHFLVLRMKTAAFIESCCRVGARLAGASEQREEALSTYGHNVGLAFQVVDDLLDFCGSSAKTGKPTATDFREGQATLPLILLLPSLDESERRFVAEKFGNSAEDADLETIVGWMTERGTIVTAEHKADALVAEAVRSLADLPQSEHRSLLESVAGFVTSRDS